MNVTMPNGEVITDVPDGTTREQLLDKLKARDQQSLGIDKNTDSPASSNFEQSPAGKLTSWLGGGLDVARSIGSTVATDAAGGIAGVGQVVMNELGVFQQDPVAVIRAWQSHAYSPTTKEGKAIAGALSVPGEVAHKAAESLGATGKQMGETEFLATKSPMVATAFELMPDMIQTILGFKGPALMKDYAANGAAQIAKDAVLNQTKTAAMRDARQNGLKVSPGEYGGGLGRTITSMSNRAEIERELSADNNGRLVELFKTNFGLPEDAAVDRGTFSTVRAQLGQPYDKGRQLPRMNIDAPYLQDILNAGSKFDQLTADFKEPELADLEQRIASLRGTYLQPSWSANSAINAMQYLRENASDLLRSDSAVDRKLGFTQRAIAEAMEDRLWRHASSSGMPDLAAEFQEARKKGSQLHVWEDSADLDKGFFSARQIVAQRKMMAGKVDPFTDELKIVADAAGAFPRSFQDIQKGTMPVSVFERYMIIGGALGTAFAGHEGSMALGGASMAVAGSGIAGRGAMTSDWWQRSMMGPQASGAGPLRRGVMAAGGAPTQAAGAVAGAESGNE